MTRQRPRLIAALAAMLLVVGLAPSASAATPPTPPGPDDGLGYYHPVSPYRVKDTRSGSPVGPGSSIAIDVTGVGGVPAAGAAAIVVNVTAVKPTSGTYLTVYPDGETRPTASNLNVVAGRTLANLVVAKIGANGNIRIFNSKGSTHVVVDIAGWYDEILGTFPAAPPAGASRFTPVTPIRALDTRSGAPIGPGATRTLTVAGVGEVPAAGIAAIAINVTAVKPTAGTYLTVYPSGESRPLASNLNVIAGATVPNMVVVKVGGDGAIKIYNNSGSAHVLVDIAGWYGAYDDADLHGAYTGLLTGGEYTPNSPVRIIDTRQDTPLGPGETGILDLVYASFTGAWLPPIGMGGVVLNVTAVNPTANTFLTVYPSDAEQPVVSNLNVAAGTTVANLVFVKSSADGYISIYNSKGTTDVIVDVAGWFLNAGDTPQTPFDSGGWLPIEGLVPPIIPAAVGARAAASGPAAGVVRQNPRTTAEMAERWSGDRLTQTLASARPMPLIERAGSAPAPRDPGTKGLAGEGRDTSAFGFAYPMWLHSHGYFDEGEQYPMVGRVFLTNTSSFTDYRGRTVPMGTFVCSGTLVARNLVLTAAHCVTSRTQGGVDVFFDDFVFVPGQYGDRPPATAWTDWDLVAAPGDTSPWFTTETNAEDLEPGDFYPADYALISFNDVGGVYPGDDAGFLPIGQSFGTWIRDVGYPAGGGFAPYCGGAPGADTCYPFSTWTFMGDAFDHGDGPQVDEGGWWEVGVGSWMTGGSSGGPMLAVDDGEVYVTSVNSNGFSYELNGVDWGLNMWGPWFNEYTFAFVDTYAVP